LIERAGRLAGQMAGRSPYMQAVHVQAPGHVLGQLVEVRIDKASEAAPAPGIQDPPAHDTPKAPSLSGAEGLA
jgi:tRNA-2-methylthio-N6-dimethylallyladenosine synthase